MVQQGQIIELTRRGRDGQPVWSYRYPTGGRDSKRIKPVRSENAQRAGVSLRPLTDWNRRLRGVHKLSRVSNSVDLQGRSSKCTHGLRQGDTGSAAQGSRGTGV